MQGDLINYSDHDKYPAEAVEELFFFSVFLFQEVVQDGNQINIYIFWQMPKRWFVV